MRDLYSDIKVVPALAPAVLAANANGVAIDLLGNQRVAFAVNTGAIEAAGAFGVKLQESDTGTSGWADVAADQVQNNAPAVLAAASAYRLGYLGWKRFIRLVLTKTGGTSLAAGAVAILSPDERPVP
ncbi:hypothetical protein [Pseudogemmobacter bohemicus]|uniref:hypothetical protein n=1 Tax=Pseudogemmobacter bohemicus TaxID=2250708 RepID=UPI000DD44EF8|nr:hypothetical protein [Pseudogemmobacter bohemicus]